jgi:carboxypeptidase C (cathepsin A)
MFALRAYAVYAFVAATVPDEIVNLPQFGRPATKQYSGFVPVTPDAKNNLFYYFVEADVFTPETPTLIWLNGGPGASSLTGLFAENLGPQKILADGQLVANEHSLTKQYNLLAVDNPVGSGFSYTLNGAYVKSEEEMREQFVAGLRKFFQLHPEYQKNPLWVTGESYAGKYVPNIAWAIHTSLPEVPLQGVIIGNGLYNATAGYSKVRDYAFGAGVIDEHAYAALGSRQDACLAKIRHGDDDAGMFCENTTVYWIYSDAVAGKLFYYDLGLTDLDMDSITTAMGKYLNRADVREALHVGDHQWVQADESGPVSDNLLSDFAKPSTTVLAQVLDAGYRVAMYNGVRDGSVCNHMGNLETILNLPWSETPGFAAARQEPWKLNGKVAGNERRHKGLSFTILYGTGHLVPVVIPETFATFVKSITSEKRRETEVFV